MIPVRVEIPQPGNQNSEFGYWCETINNTDPNNIRLIVVLDDGRVIWSPMDRVIVINETNERNPFQLGAATTTTEPI